MKEKIKNFFKKISVWSWFKKAMFIYAFLLVTVLVVFLCWEWNQFAKYQKSYDSSKTAGNPDLYIEKYVDEFTEEVYRDALDTVVPEDNIFCSKDTIIDRLLNDIKDKNISWKRNEEAWNDFKPAYLIFAGDTEILKVAFGIESKDDFGFSRWNISSAVADYERVLNNTVEFTITNSMTAKINGVDVPDTAVSGEIDAEITSAISEMTGTEYKEYKYRVENLMEDFSLVVTDVAGNELKCKTSDDNVRDYIVKYTDEEAAELKDTGISIMKDYVKYINRWITSATMLKRVDSNSELYTYLKRVAGAIIWNEMPDNITYNSEEILDLKRISADRFYCKIRFDIKKDYAPIYGNVMDNYENENIKQEIIVRLINGNWYLEYMNVG